MLRSYIMSGASRVLLWNRKLPSHGNPNASTGDGVICRASRKMSAAASKLRRQRRYTGQHPTTGSMPSFGRLEAPFDPDEDSMDDYLKKTSLSPWVPLPDSAARKLFDLAHAQPHDVHVDLGSGDGRVNFHAIDYGILQSTGIDVDEAIVQIARDRLAKRHPPPNVQFVLADLTDPDHSAWNIVQEATLITMYFAQEALTLFRPLLERKLAGRECTIICCGYEMPGWEAHISEVVLGMQLHLYKWGSTVDDDQDFAFLGEDILKQKPVELDRDPLASNQFAGSKVIDRTGDQILFDSSRLSLEEDETDEWSSDEEDEEVEDSLAETVNGEVENEKPR